jgi:acyl-[acyl-carrier-protein]-phospholipid O-acyltransferase/long-chain-fatty-acid--[acyl-carrier-protein] ligase
LSSILLKADFWPLFGAQACGAFNDNFFRSALLAYLAFGQLDLDETQKSILGSSAMGLMMLPFFLFSSLAGELADRLRKSSLLKIVKASEVFIMLGASFFFIQGQIYALLLILFCMGAQSAFFGPLKYGLLPEVLTEEQLIGGNGLVEASTFLSIVLGSLAGSWLGAQSMGVELFLPAALPFAALLGLLFMLKQPISLQKREDIHIHPQIWRSTWEIIASVKGRPDMWLVILGISWFWAVGGILLTQLPVLCSSSLGGTPAVNAFLVTSLALGIALGALAAQALLQGRVNTDLTPVSSILLTLGGMSLFLCVRSLPQTAPGSVTLEIFFSHWVYLRLALSCLLLSLAGGLFVVPLNAFLQHRARPEERARVIAANNILNSLFIVLGSLCVILLTGLGAGLSAIFAFVGISALPVMFIALYLRFDAPLYQLMRLIYRPQVSGLEYLEKVRQGPALVIPNHSAFLDVAMLVAYIPRPLSFAIDVQWAKAWWVRPFVRVFKCIPVNPTQPAALRRLVAALKQGEMVVIFPEGRITHTGGLMKIYEGTGLIAAKSETAILPVVINGVQHTLLGRMRSLLRRPPRRPKVSMRIMPPIYPASGPDENKPTGRRRGCPDIYEIMLQSRFAAADIHKNLWRALHDEAVRCGPKLPILEDRQRRPLTYAALIRQAALLGRRLQDLPDTQVGVLLPGSIAGAAAFFALWAGGRTAVPLHYSLGPDFLAAALKTAGLKTIITSREFLEEADLSASAAKLPVELIMLEDQRFSPADNLTAHRWPGRPAPPDHPALVFIRPQKAGGLKSISLSHCRLLANIHQTACMIENNEDDILFNPMPWHSAFGLNTGLLFPLLRGLKSLQYPYPQQAKVIPELIYDSKAGLVLGADEAALLWGMNAHPYDFFNVRFMLLNGPIRRETFELYTQKLSLRLFSGLALDEAASLLCLNTRMRSRYGSCGHLLPGVQTRLESVPDKPYGQLWAKGPNIAAEDWLDTGLQARCDADGFIWIDTPEG